MAGIVGMGEKPDGCVGDVVRGDCVIHHEGKAVPVAEQVLDLDDIHHVVFHRIVDEVFGHRCTWEIGEGVMDVGVDVFER